MTVIADIEDPVVTERILAHARETDPQTLYRCYCNRARQGSCAACGQGNRL